jgi:hypothetical protein
VSVDNVPHRHCQQSANKCPYRAGKQSTETRSGRRTHPQDDGERDPKPTVLDEEAVAPGQVSRDRAGEGSASSSKSELRLLRFEKSGQCGETSPKGEDNSVRCGGLQRRFYSSDESSRGQVTICTTGVVACEDVIFLRSKASLCDIFRSPWMKNPPQCFHNDLSRRRYKHFLRERTVPSQFIDVHDRNANFLCDGIEEEPHRKDEE